MALVNEKQIKKAARILLVAGAINWGLVEFAKFDLVEFLSFDMGWLYSVLIGAVAAAGLYAIWKRKEFM